MSNKAAREDMLHCLADVNPQALTVHGYEDALIGVCYRFGQEPLAAYSRSRIIQILMRRDGMTEEEADEFFEFNIIGSGLGEHTPVFLDLI